MPERTDYAPGTPSWVDLATPDPGAAKEFYGGLFGWDFTDEPVDGGSVYTMCTLGSRPVAGMMMQTPELRDQGMPPMWTSYVSVADVDATVGAVAGAGGSVMMPPMDVMDAGRMAVIADPTGAAIAVWEKGQHAGAGLVNEHGALAWNELQTSDVDAAAAFYGAIFGWSADAHDMGDMIYTEFKVGDAGVAGGMKLPVEGLPPYWAVYFAHDDVDAAVARATELGGHVVAPVMDGPPGRWAFLADPQGGVFAAITLSDPGA